MAARAMSGASPSPSPSKMAIPVICAGCKRTWSIPEGVTNFTCRFCNTLQTIAPLLHRPVPSPTPLGLNVNKFTFPCVGCGTLLNIPLGLQRFMCPNCKAELAFDPVKLAAFMNNSAQYANAFNEMSQHSSNLENLKRKLQAMSGNLGHQGSSNVKRYHSLVPSIPQTVPPQPPPQPQPPPPPPPEKEEINELALDIEQEEEEDGPAGETFTDYRVSQNSIGPPHPDHVVETSSLSAVEPPPATIELTLKNVFLENGSLSSLQLETVTYACQRHEQILPDNFRAGFFLGDGAGVGKGRTIAALIYENWINERKKALWISVGSDLKFDARRDLDDVGCFECEVHALNKLPYGKLDSRAIGIKEGVIFLTYNSLIATSEKGKSRLQQLVQWCGNTFDGLIIFDECHKAKNLVAENGASGTRTGEGVVELQNKLPSARIIYCSATGASEARNLGYMVRLGLWGEGTDFPNFQAFLSALDKRGVGAYELLAMDMKARGMYFCRTLSYTGAEFEVINVKLDLEMNEMYTVSTQFWAELRVELMNALISFSTQDGFLKDNSKKNSKTNLQKNIWRHYWSTNQRFFRHMCMSAKINTAVQLTKKALEEGKCVVIGLQSTGEARTEEVMSKYGNELDDFVSGPRELLLKFVDEYYPLPPKPDEPIEKEKVEAEKKPKPNKSGPSISQRGRVRKVVKYKGFDNSDEDEDYMGKPSPDEKKEEQSEEDTENEDFVFNVCNVCRQEDDEENMVKCKECNKFMHLDCASLPLDEEMTNDFSCGDCRQNDNLREEREAYNSELRIRYNLAVERKNAILDIIKNLSLPNNPLDELIDQLGGPDCVAEMTGRRGMFVRSSSGKGVLYQTRNSKDVTQEMINMHEKQLFMDGKKLIALISEASSAGVSLQADRRSINQRRRVHLTLELPWSADKAIQQFGRTHRSNQLSAPQYRLIFTNLGGENRFASIVAKRLETLGALTQGDRRAGPSLSAYNYDSVWGRKSLSIVYKSIVNQTKPPAFSSDFKNLDDLETKNLFQIFRAALICVGIIRDCQPIPDDDTYLSNLKPSGKIIDSDVNDVARFLNRLLSLEPCVQNKLFEFFVCIFDHLIKNARKEGNFDSGIVDIKAKSVEIVQQTKTIRVDTVSGAPTSLTVVKMDRGMDWEDVNKIYESSSSDSSKSRNELDQQLGEEDKVNKNEEETEEVNDKKGEMSEKEMNDKDNKEGNEMQGVEKVEIETEEKGEIKTRNKKTKNNSKSFDGFYRSRRDWLGRSHVLLAIRSSHKVFNIYRPSTGKSIREMSLAELENKYVLEKDLNEAKKRWIDEYEFSENSCMHGLKCKIGTNCTVGKRIILIHVIGGLVFPIWKLIETALSKLEKPAHRRLRIVRIETTSEKQRIVGVHIPEKALHDVLMDIEKSQPDPAS